MRGAFGGGFRRGCFFRLFLLGRHDAADDDGEYDHDDRSADNIDVFGVIVPRIREEFADFFKKFFHVKAPY